MKLHKTEGGLVKRFATLLSLTLTAVSLNAQTEISATLPEGAARAAASITRDVLEAPIRFLADDLLEGRGPATRGDELARLYIATELEQLGLQPVQPDGSWQQPFDVVSINTKMPDTWTFRAKSGDVSFKRHDDFILGSGQQKAHGSVNNAELVFVGYGIEAPEYKWSDYEKTDVRGKIVVVMNNDPDWDPKLFEGTKRLYYGRWGYKYEEAARQGAAGVIIIHTTPSAGYPFSVVQTSWSGNQFELPAENEPRLQLKAWMTEDAIRRLFTAAGHDYDKLIASAKSTKFKPVPLGLRTSIDVQADISRVKTANVLGLLPGSDPVLKNEVVVITAHHDHLGIGSPDESGDKIYNGALDNATGTSVVLAIAKAFTELPRAPRRSILFLFVGAEEQGLLGSQYYATHPTWPAGRFAANINFDGANVLGRTKDVAIIGAGKSNLETLLTHFAQQQGRVTHPEEFPDRGFYYRSDQFSFAKVGVPALYFDAGTDYAGRPPGWGKQQMEAWEAKHYHQPSDEVTDEWNYEGMIEDAQLGFYTALAAANSSVAPAWNPGDEFEATRKKALAEVGVESGTALPAKGN